MKKTYILLLFLVSMIFPHVVSADYTISVLNTIGGHNYGAANKINNKGQIIGRNDLKNSNNTYSFFWEDGKIKPIGNFGGYSVSAIDINERAQAIGTIKEINQPEGTLNIKPYLWDNGKLIDLSSYFPDNSAPFLAGINNSGDIVGNYKITPQGSIHAFLLQNGILTDLGTFGGDYSSARDINDNGQIAGTYGWNSRQLAHGFIWEDGEMTDLDEITSPYNIQIAGINNAGQIAGSRQYIGQWQAFRWENGTFTNVGDLNNVEESSAQYSLASGINNHGSIVGESWYVDPEGVAYLRAFLWKNGVISNLGSEVPGSSSYSSATGINDNDQIVGYNLGFYNNDTNQYFLKALFWK